MPVEDFSVDVLRRSPIIDIFAELELQLEVWHDRVLFSLNEELITNMIEAYQENDVYRIGLLYGYPECCAKHYVNLTDPQSYMLNALRMAIVDGKRIREF